MAKDQEPRTEHNAPGNSLIQSLIEDEQIINPEDEASRFGPVQAAEQTEEIQEQVEKPAQVANPQAVKPENDQAPKSQKYVLKGKSQENKAPTAQSEENESGPSEPVMTADFVKANGLPKEMIGLPFSELGRSYRNLVGEFTRTRQKFAEFERSGNEFGASRSEKPVREQVKAPEVEPPANAKTLKEKVLEKMTTLPDPLDEGYNQALANAFVDILQQDREEQKERIIQEALSKVRPDIESVQQYARETAQTKLLNSIQSKLPEGVDPMMVISAFKEDYGEDLADMLPVYEKKPHLFVKHLVEFFEKNFELQGAEEKAAAPDIQAELTEAEIARLAQKRAAEAMKESKRKQPSDLNSQQKKVTPKRSSLMQDLLDTEEEYFKQLNP